MKQSEEKAAALPQTEGCFHARDLSFAGAMSLALVLAILAGGFLLVPPEDREPDAASPRILTDNGLGVVALPELDPDPEVRSQGSAGIDRASGMIGADNPGLGSVGAGNDSTPVSGTPTSNGRRGLTDATPSADPIAPALDDRSEERASGPRGAPADPGHGGSDVDDTRRQASKTIEDGGTVENPATGNLGADSDGDGIADQRWVAYGLPPNTPPDGDADGDGISNRNEILSGTSPNDKSSAPWMPDPRPSENPPVDTPPSRPPDVPAVEESDSESGEPLEPNPTPEPWSPLLPSDYPPAPEVKPAPLPPTMALPPIDGVEAKPQPEPDSGGSRPGPMVPAPPLAQIEPELPQIPLPDLDPELPTPPLPGADPDPDSAPAPAKPDAGSDSDSKPSRPVPECDSKPEPKPIEPVPEREPEESEASKPEPPKPAPETKPAEPAPTQPAPAAPAATPPAPPTAASAPVEPAQTPPPPPPAPTTTPTPAAPAPAP